MAVVDRNIALGEQRLHFLVDRRDGEHRGVVRVVDHLERAAAALAARLVVGDERDLERRAGAFHLARRPPEQADAAGLDETVDRRRRGRGLRRAGIDRGDAALADQRRIHAGDRAVVEHQTGGDEQEVIGNALAGRGHHRLGVGIELRHRLLDPGHAARHVVFVALGDMLRRPDAGGHQRVAGLEVVLLLGIDQRDGPRSASVAQPRGEREPGRAGAGNDDAGARLGCLRLRPSRDQPACRERGGSCQKFAPFHRFPPWLRAKRPAMPILRGHFPVDCFHSLRFLT